MSTKEKLIEEMYQKGILINKELLEKEIDLSVTEKIETEQDLIVLNEDYLEVISQQTSLVDWYEIDEHRVAAEKDKDDELYQTELQSLRKINLQVGTESSLQQQEVSSLEIELSGEGSELTGSTELPTEDPLEFTAPLLSSDGERSEIDVVTTYINLPSKYTVKDFTKIFSSRYRFLEGLLRGRQELQRTTTINRILNKNEKENVSIIGVIQDIGISRNDNLILKVEDPTGVISVVASKNKTELFNLARDLVLDEVVGISGMSQGNVVFLESVIWPDVPNDIELKKSNEEEYAVFPADFHVGSTFFLKEEFNKFLAWISGKAGNEAQREIANKVKYIIIPGDLVDGVGIYPLQEKELEIDDITKQYEEFCRLIRQIPSDKQIIICPGNHDVVHLAEPQPAFYKEFAPQLFELPNVTLVSNPAMINIGKTADFSGFDILLYHGFSFDYYVNNVESIRNNGGYHRADLIMKFLLKRRHLAPSFRSTPYFPGHSEDPLLIKKVPDFFVTGHIHYCSVANYKNITMISGSCWQAATPFQDKLGHDPEPARVPIVNLKTREVKILRFN